MKCSLGISNFLEEISSLSHSVVFLYFFALIAEEGFLISSTFRCLYLSFSPLLFTSLLFTAICKAFPDSHFAFLHFFSMGMVLIPPQVLGSTKGIWEAHRELACKSRKSRDTWSDRQVWPWSIKGSRAKVNRVLPRELTDHSKHSLPKTQEMTSTHGYHKVINSEIRLNILFVAKDGEVLYSQQKQDLELTVAQIMSSSLQNSDLH